MEEFWSEEEEEVLAFIAADMHQDARAWEAVWQKDEDLKPRLIGCFVCPRRNRNRDT